MPIYEVFNPTCKACPLYLSAGSVCIPGRRVDDRLIEEDYHPRVMIVGEAPGPREAKDGACFVGPAGHKLREFLDTTGFDPAEVYLTNVCKCFPRTASGFREPTPTESLVCTSLYLENEIHFLQPEWIVPVGNTALHWFTGHKQISRYHGKIAEVTLPTEDWMKRLTESDIPKEEWPERRVYKVLPTYHPAATCYPQGAKYTSAILQDLALLQEKATGRTSVSTESHIYAMDKATLDRELGYLDVLAQKGVLEFICLDVETGPPFREEFRLDDERGLDPYNPGENLLLCFSLCYRPPGSEVLRSIGIPYEHPQSPWAQDRVMIAYIRQRVSEILEKVPLLNHNLKFDLLIIDRKGFTYGKVYGDTMLKSWVLHNSLTFHDLETVAANYAGIVAHKADMDAHKAAQKTKNFTFCDLPILLNYCCRDTNSTVMADGGLNQALQAAGLYRVNDHLQTESILPHLWMELNGCALDRAALAVLEVEYKNEALSYEQRFSEWGYAAEVERVLALKPGGFKLGNPGHLGSVLKDCLHISIPKENLTATGKVGTDKDTLQEYVEQYQGFVLDEEETAEESARKTSKWCRHVVDALKTVQKHKKTTKTLSSYVRNLPKHVRADGLLHANYGICRTNTGRDNCVDPALLTLPRKSAVKRAIVSRWPTGLIAQADYAQFEVRVLAMASEDEKLIGIFQSGKDIYREMAGETLRRKPEGITYDERQIMKTVVLGTSYGRQAPSIAADLGISERRAQEFVDGFFRNFKGAARWVKRQHALAAKQGYVETLHGWRRYLPADQFRDDERDRRAQNSPIQGTAAHLTAEALQRIYAAHKVSKLRSLLTTFVYDSLGWDLWPGEVIPVLSLLQKQMRDMPARIHPWATTVPLGVDLELGPSWGALCHVTLLGGTRAEVVGPPGTFQGLWAQCSSWEGQITPDLIEVNEYQNAEGKPEVKALIDFPLPDYL